MPVREFMGELDAPQVKEFTGPLDVTSPSQTASPKDEGGLWDTLNDAAGSWVNYGMNIYNAVTNPMDTAKALGNLAVGGLQMMSPFDEPLPAYDKRQYPRAMGQYYADRYGSPGQAWESLTTDPAATLGDLSLVGAGGGGLLSAAGKVPRLGKLGAAGQALTRGAVAIDPMALAFNLPKPVMQAMIPERTPINLYEKEALFSKALPQATRDKMARTALDAKLMPTPTGVEKGRAIIKDLESQLAAIENAAPDTPIPINAVLGRFGKLRKKFGGPGIDAQKNLQVIDEVARNLRESVERLGRDWVTPKELSQIKKDTYRSINWQDPKMATENVARKAVGRQAQEILAKEIPDAVDINKQLSDMYQLMGKPSSPKPGPLERAAARINDRNLVSLGAPLRAMSGAGIGHMLNNKVAGFLIGAGLVVADLPRIKAKLAMGLNNVKKASKSDMVLRNSFLKWMAKQTGVTDRAELLKMAQQEVEDFDTMLQEEVPDTTVSN